MHFSIQILHKFLLDLQEFINNKRKLFVNRAMNSMQQNYIIKWTPNKQSQWLCPEQHSSTLNKKSVVCNHRILQIVYNFKCWHMIRLIVMATRKDLYSNDGTAVHGWESKGVQLVGWMVLSIRLTLVNHEHVLAHLNRIGHLMLSFQHFAWTAF